MIVIFYQHCLLAYGSMLILVVSFTRENKRAPSIPSEIRKKHIRSTKVVKPSSSYSLLASDHFHQILLYSFPIYRSSPFDLSETKTHQNGTLRNIIFIFMNDKRS